MQMKIGVVAGAGPYAGLDLVKKILEETVAERDQDHLDVIALFEPNALADRTAYLLGETHENPAVEIAQQVERLAEAGAVVAAIPCNTAHAPPIYDEMMRLLMGSDAKIRFLNMISETVAHLGACHPRLQRVGVLATTGTIRARVYAEPLERKGYRVIVPRADIQETVVHPAIYAAYGIKTLGYGSERARRELIGVVAQLVEAGAEVVVLGCTELPLALPETMLAGVELIDPTRVLARALIRNAAPDQLRPI